MTTRRNRPAPPLDAPALERLALRYVERFATTRGKLADYLRRKIRERGWEGTPADPDGVADRMAALGYVDDRAWAAAKAGAMARRGLGERRVDQALKAARVGGEDAASVAPAVADEAVASALRFARRKRLGPFAEARADRAVRQKQLAAMLRAGHPFALARAVVDAGPGEEDFTHVVDLTHCEEPQAC